MTIQNDGTDTASTMTTSTTIGKINVAAQRAKVEARFTALVNGINSELTDLTTLMLGDKQVPKAEVVSRLQARINAAEKTKAARLALHAAVAEEALTVADTTPLVGDMKSMLQGRYGKKSPKMQIFGFTQAKEPQRSVAGKAQGVTKAKATRQKVGPVGKKQRKAAAAANVAPAAVAAPATTPTPGTNGGK